MHFVLFQLEVDYDNYLNFVLNVTIFKTDKTIEQLWKINNKTDWTTHSYSTAVNAFYDSSENSMRTYVSYILKASYMQILNKIKILLEYTNSYSTSRNKHLCINMNMLKEKILLFSNFTKNTGVEVKLSLVKFYINTYFYLKRQLHAEGLPQPKLCNRSSRKHVCRCESWQFAHTQKSEMPIAVTWRHLSYS